MFEITILGCKNVIESRTVRISQTNKYFCFRNIIAFKNSENCVNRFNYYKRVLIVTN